MARTLLYLGVNDRIHFRFTSGMKSINFISTLWFYYYLPAVVVVVAPAGSPAARCFIYMNSVGLAHPPRPRSPKLLLLNNLRLFYLFIE